VTHFKHGDFSTCNAPLPGQSKTVTTLEIIDQIHELILEEHRISAKSTPKQLDISPERIGSTFYEDLDMRKLSAKWVPKCLTWIKKVNGAKRLRKFWNFSGTFQIISYRDYRLWTKPGYITITRRQSNNQWSGSIEAKPAPKKFQVLKSAGKFSP